jgi:alpha-L-arabinofuranosidase
MGDEQWFSNKDLFLMLEQFKKDMADISAEMRQTRDKIAQYNGLRQRIEDCAEEILAMKSKADGQSSVGKAIREWGGWLIGVISFFIMIWKLGV